MHCFVCLALILDFVHVHVLHGAPSIFRTANSALGNYMRMHPAFPFGGSPQRLLWLWAYLGENPPCCFTRIQTANAFSRHSFSLALLWNACWLSCIAISTACFTQIQAAVASQIHGFCPALLWTACCLSCIASSTACLTNFQAAAAFSIQGLCLALLWTACWPSCIAFSTACPFIVFNTLWCFCLSLHAGPAAEQNC